MIFMKWLSEQLHKWLKRLGKARYELMTFLVGLILFVILWGLVIDGIVLEGFVRTAIGGITGFGALATLLAFVMKGSRL